MLNSHVETSVGVRYIVTEAPGLRRVEIDLGDYFVADRSTVSLLTYTGRRLEDSISAFRSSQGRQSEGSSSPVEWQRRFGESWTSRARHARRRIDGTGTSVAGPTSGDAVPLLVIWDYGNQKIRFAGFNYLVSTHLGLFVLVAAFMLLHSHTASMDFRAFGDFLSHPNPGERDFGMPPVC